MILSKLLPQVLLAVVVVTLVSLRIMVVGGSDQWVPALSVTHHAACSTCYYAVPHSGSCITANLKLGLRVQRQVP